MKNKFYLFIEFLLLFCGLPLVLYFLRLHLAHMIVGIIVLFAAGCSIFLLTDRDFDARVFFKIDHFRIHLKSILFVFVIPAMLVAVAAYFFLNGRFLSFPKENPIVWIMVLFLYPPLAAYPQEIIFRGFFFHRYRLLFPKKTTMIIISSFCFSLAHLFYGNWVAPLLAGAGGVLFACRYLKSKSLLIVGIEHGLWGNFLFSIGIGWFFYSGAIQ